MSIVIRTPIDITKLVEKRMGYRFWDKGRERSNHASQIAASGIVAQRCLMRHENTAWSGPPYDPVRAYVCIDCHAAASELEIRDRGFNFEDIPDWELKKILDLDLQRQLQPRRSFYIPKGTG